MTTAALWRVPTGLHGWCGGLRALLLSGLLATVACAGSAPAGAADEVILCGWDEVFILPVTGSGAIGSDKVWSWRGADRPELPPHLRGTFNATDECKPVEGGAKILITSSGGGVALVERASGKALFHAFVGNAHSAEMLPGKRVAVAGSVHPEGNRLTVFDLDRPERAVYSEELYSGHGVVWDEPRGILWALGYAELKAFRLRDWDTSEPTLEPAGVHRFPGTSGHDLTEVPGSDDLLVTTTEHVLLFNRRDAAFRLHPELGNAPHVKGVSIHPATGQWLIVQAEGENWWASRVRTLYPAGELHLPGERLYKARWNSAPGAAPAR